MAVRLPKGYMPSDDEPFMNKRQKEYFRRKLEKWKEDILIENRETLQHLQDDSVQHPDLADRASSETERSLELRTRDRQRKLIAKIDAAIRRIAISKWRRWPASSTARSIVCWASARMLLEAGIDTESTGAGRGAR